VKDEAATVTRCVALLGGSFDPVHNGHVALANYFIRLFQPDELRIIPAGNPWQKHGLQASGADRIAMVRTAFGAQKIPVQIDQQEIRRPRATYTIETLQAIREELGPDVSLIFLMGADQLQHLNSWQSWQQLFDYAHICAAARPGFAMDASAIPDDVAQEFARRGKSGTNMQDGAWTGLSGTRSGGRYIRHCTPRSAATRGTPDFAGTSRGARLY
jgi:nicotinate-nucleotide adenylyltransferase